MSANSLRMTINTAQGNWIRAVVDHAIEQARALRRGSKNDASKSLLASRIKYLGDIQAQLNGPDLIIPIDVDHSSALARELRAVATNIKASFRVAADDTESYAAVQAAFLDRLSQEIFSAL